MFWRRSRPDSLQPGQPSAPASAAAASPSPRISAISSAQGGSSRPYSQSGNNPLARIDEDAKYRAVRLLETRCYYLADVVCRYSNTSTQGLLPTSGTSAIMILQSSIMGCSCGRLGAHTSRSPSRSTHFCSRQCKRSTSPWHSPCQQKPRR